MTNATAPLDQPLYGATLPQAVTRFFKKYATFSGRASRSEFWWTFLVLFLLFAVLGILAGVLGTITQGSDRDEPGPGGIPFIVLIILGFLATVVPTIALHVRRLHDGNFSGLLYLLTLIPNIGSLIVLIFMILPSNPLGARFDAGAQQYPPQAYPPQAYGQPGAVPPAPPTTPPAPPAP